MKAIINGRLIIPGTNGIFELRENSVILFDKTIGEIITQEEFYRRSSKIFEDKDIIDVKGQYVSPGFVNVHVHGCIGCDTMDGSEKALKKMADFQAKTGVTSFLPTTMTYDMPRIYAALDMIKAVKENEDGAAILGVNMEGPFISEGHKGAQKSANIQKADFRLIESRKDIIKIITLAPETLPAGSDFISDCHKAGIVVSLGHTDASYECAMNVICKEGVKHITHLFNAMTGLHHREPGVVGAAMDSDVFCELIADNIHSAPAAQRIVHRVKGLGRVVLITDSMRACGLGDGESELGGQRVFVTGQKAVLDDGTIAGSVLTMDRAIYNYAKNLNIPVWQAVECASLTPAKSIGMDKEIGSLTVGKRADMAIFDDEVNITMTFRNGKRIF